MIEEEYLRTSAEAELRWVRSIIDELESGELHWNTEELLTYAPPKVIEDGEAAHREE